jgi:hypothetical protein
MGFFRKAASISTAGLIDFRSDKERTARYARQTRNAVREQTRAQVQQQPVTAPGWYRDPAGMPCLRWWDGRSWTAATAPLQP